jgi:hypothetical protein
MIFIKPLKMDLTEGSETSAQLILTPGKYQKESIQAGQTSDDNMAHAHFLLYSYLKKHTIRICNAYCLVTATMVARTRLNVTMYVKRYTLSKQQHGGSA